MSSVMGSIYLTDGAMWIYHPWLRGRSPSGLRHHLPLMIFDDAGPISATGSTVARCWYSLLGRVGGKECRFIMCTGLKDAVGEDRSWPVILQSFRRSKETKNLASYKNLFKRDNFKITT